MKTNIPGPKTNVQYKTQAPLFPKSVLGWKHVCKQYATHSRVVTKTGTPSLPDIYHSISLVVACALGFWSCEISDKYRILERVQIAGDSMTYQIM